MCKLKSAIILKDRVFIPDYDSHSDMLTELGIEDTLENAERLFVRAELSPRNCDIFSPIDEWEFTVDQDIHPEWFVESYEKERMIAAVKEWAKAHIHVGVNGLKISAGSNHCIKDCKNVEITGSASVKNICGSASVENICDSARVEYITGSASVKNICGSASVESICDSASVEYIHGSARVKSICDSASVKNICDSATVKNICDSASVKYICDSAVVSCFMEGWKNKNNVTISGNATFRDFESKIIYQAGDWELRLLPAKEAES